MRRVAALLVALALPAFGAGSESGPPGRICSLSLAGDEMLALLVPPERVVCVSTFADDAELSNVPRHYPPRTARLVARVEPVLAARPDLVVVAPWNEPSFRGVLEKTGIAVHLLPDAADFPEIASALIALGERVGAADRARAAVAEMERRLAALDARIAPIKKREKRVAASGHPHGLVRVLAFSHLIVAGRGTTVDAIIARAGGTNVAAELGVKGHKQLPLEQIIAADPDWLLLGFDPGEKVERLLEAYPLLKSTRAAREGRVLVMSPRRLTTVTPYLAEGAEELARALHPDAFR